MSHFNDLLEVLNFYQENSKQELSEKLVNILEEMTLQRLRSDRDLTLQLVNSNHNKNLYVCQPYLFKPSTRDIDRPRTAFYDNVLQILQD